MRTASTEETKRSLKGNQPTYWVGFDLGRERSEPLLVSLARYRRRGDRVWAPTFREANLRSSQLGFRTHAWRDDAWPEGSVIGRWHWPILDLDVPHTYVPSSTPGHGHLSIEIPTAHWRWVLLMLALRLAGVHETGYTAWSLRRGANFVRVPWVPKADPPPPAVRYGWLFRRKP